MVAEEHPKLNKGDTTNPGNGEESNPFDADSNAETKSSQTQPEPPSW